MLAAFFFMVMMRILMINGNSLRIDDRPPGAEYAHCHGGHRSGLRTAMAGNYGSGGTCACLVLQKYLSLRHLA